MRATRVISFPLLVFSISLLPSCSKRTDTDPAPSGTAQSREQAIASSIPDPSTASCVSARLALAAKQHANDVRLGVARGYREASNAERVAENARRAEALAIQRSQGPIPSRDNPQARTQYMRAQFWATWASNYALRMELATNTAEVIAWASNLTAKDWREYAEYAELQAVAFAHADSGSSARNQSLAAAHKSLFEQTISEIAEIEETSPEMRSMYALEFAAESENGSCRNRRRRS